MDKNIIKDGISKATAEFTQRIEPLGFQRTKKWLWVREYESSADFLHIHVNGSSYGGPISYAVSFRIQCGNRSFSDAFDALELNGPNSNDSEFHSARYHMRFNTKSGSTYERCMDDLVRFVTERGEKWFKKQSENTKTSNIELSQTETISRKLLGLKGIKRETT